MEHRIHPRRRVADGFTLVEIMLVVAVIAILSAVAIPAMARYRRRAASSEAVDKLALIYRMSASYATHEAARRGVAAGVMTARFPESATLTPAAVPAGVRIVDPAGTWDQPGWQALTFAISDPHYYAYAYDSAGVGTNARFTARAMGDLDGDGQTSTFERAGALNAHLEVVGSAGIWMQNEIE